MCRLVFGFLVGRFLLILGLLVLRLFVQSWLILRLMLRLLIGWVLNKDIETLGNSFYLLLLVRRLRIPIFLTRVSLVWISIPILWIAIILLLLMASPQVSLAVLQERLQLVAAQDVRAVKPAGEQNI